MSMFAMGSARRSMHHPDPVLHLLVRGGTGEWATWCGGGLADVANTVTQRRCRRCLALAQADIAEMGLDANEESDLDWYVNRAPARKVARR